MTAMRYATTLGALVLCGVASSVLAHAMLDHAEPRVGATVTAPPHVVSLWFTQKLEAAFSKIEVRDSSGARVDAGAAQVDDADPAVLRVGLKPLPAGVYRVDWQVLSVDTHTTEGHFSFHVGK
jgi:methionine-rich copper-binding protein CopC